MSTNFEFITMNRYCIGDIHGAYKALLQVLERSGFSKEEDQLICLGDVADGWSETPECFDELLTIKNLIYILGNHDEWLYNWLKYGDQPLLWIRQGGQATIEAYMRRFMEEGTVFSLQHAELLKKANIYYVTHDNKCFIHGGFNWHFPIIQTDKNTLLWDRHLFEVACMWEEQQKELIIVKEFNEIFIGHTSTSYTHPHMEPVHVSNIWNLDQGAGWHGKLTLMNIDTKKFWQSDITKTLYPYEKGR